VILIFNIKTLGIEEALKLHVGSFRSSQGDYSSILALREYIRYAHHTLSDSDVDVIQRYIDNIHEIVIKTHLRLVDKITYIKGQLQKIRYNRLSLDLLEGINFEINQDREEVKHYLQKFKFNPELIKSIQFVENSYQSAKSDFDYKACADQLRSFTTELTKEIALKIADHDSESNIGNKYHKYLHDKHFFNSGKESELFKSFISYLSLDSVHRLSGEREMARISKNLVIEFALLLSQRLEVYLDKE
ncbi:MAG: hypothetical protein QQN41_07720, partial [Nitrosopumilus sp.]